MIRLTVMMYIRYPLSLRQVQDLLFLPRERNIGEFLVEKTFPFHQVLHICPQFES
jgi:hypothetical protein